ncbi:hypothetical protein ACQKM2_31500 [Streptomyces sp. NPDC004126]|uniref:hypothetical protein n=1 Tax=Streptomyces sp. NPDC004126 TaxID=3390695 RepID=UPI003D093655
MAALAVVLAFAAVAIVAKTTRDYLILRQLRAFLADSTPQDRMQVCLLLATVLRGASAEQQALPERGSAAGSPTAEP